MKLLKSLIGEYKVVRVGAKVYAGIIQRKKVGASKRERSIFGRFVPGENIYYLKFSPQPEEGPETMPLHTHGKNRVVQDRDGGLSIRLTEGVSPCYQEFM